MAAFRDATIFKTAYAFGMRRTETQMLDASDFGRNPEASEFADFGAVHVRHGKAKRASPPKRAARASPRATGIGRRRASQAGLG